jgi:hypothetical protein
MLRCVTPEEAARLEEPEKSAVVQTEGMAVTAEPANDLLKKLDDRVRRIEQILPTLVSDARLEAAFATLATKADVDGAISAAVAPLATKAELHSAIADTIAPLATKADLRDFEERLRRHLDVVAESLRDDIRLIAENLALLGQRMEQGFAEVRRDISHLDRRVARLEMSR